MAKSVGGRWQENEDLGTFFIFQNSNVTCFIQDTYTHLGKKKKQGHSLVCVTRI